MDDLLFLAHRIPYPPRKGDKIRSYHLLRALAERYRVHLGAFVDDAEDECHGAAVAAICTGETRLIQLDPWRAKWRAVRGVFTGDALTLPYYDHPQMRAWVGEILQRHPIRRVVVYSAAPAQFLRGIDPSIRRVIDFVDVDSAKWGEYAEGRSGFARWLYRRESRALLAAEKEIASTFDAALFVSEPEAALFRSLAPESEAKIDYWENGVDLEFFSPDRDYSNPFQPGELPLVFTGAMDYWPNVDAVTWFAHEVFPRVRSAIPEARWVIVGGRPTREVLKLRALPGVVVTGNVPDVRPWLYWSKAAVAPLRIARGIQNKVLEAMAMGRPVLATSQAMEGVRHGPLLRRWMADSPDELVVKAKALLMGADEDGAQPACGQLGRALMQEQYHWGRNLARAMAAVEGLPMGFGV
ncbi:MAG: TIGR03087 family PEP-CTERM/XrtA system glycosyltransferase [Magnetococcales bacterium]|nr:TIGR03087 family PEP-CTERM/XrtA system glycosyltransferase [Magnetococcales bacterium]